MFILMLVRPAHTSNRKTWLERQKLVWWKGRHIIIAQVVSYQSYIQGGYQVPLPI